MFAGIPLESGLGADDVPADASELFLPMGVAFGADGTAWIADFRNHRIRQVDPDGRITTVSGTGVLGDGPEGDAADFGWLHPTDVALDPDDPDRLWVAAWQNSRINTLDLADGTARFAVGTGGRDYAEGPALDAVLDLPSSVAFDSLGNLYVSDQHNQAIRRLRPDGVVELVAGSPGEPFAGRLNSELVGSGAWPEGAHEDATPGYSGDGGPAIDALLYTVIGASGDPSGRLAVHDDVLYVADSGNNVIRAIDLDTGIIDRVAGLPWHGRTEGLHDPLPSVDDSASGDGGPALEATLNDPKDVAVGPDGSLYIADTGNHCVRVVSPGGTIDTLAGRCGVRQEPDEPWTGEGLPAWELRLNAPYAVTVDPDGDVLISDTKNHVVLRVAR